jgi:hypothetical protein
VVLLIFMIFVRILDAEISCGAVAPCTGYLKGGGGDPSPACCSGLKKLIYFFHHIRSLPYYASKPNYLRHVVLLMEKC